MKQIEQAFDMKDAVHYHYGQFPPRMDALNLAALFKPMSAAASALARYDQMLKGMHDSEILLAPLRRQEAVVSSRMEGTISTLDEVLRYEAEQDDHSGSAGRGWNRNTLEVFQYAMAMRTAQRQIDEGVPLSNWLIRTMHAELLRFGRGSDMSPGEYKSEQNYLVDKTKKKVLFIPINPESLPFGIEFSLERFGFGFFVFATGVQK